MSTTLIIEASFLGTYFVGIIAYLAIFKKEEEIDEDEY